MKITFNDLRKRKEWLHKEIIRSMTPELIIKAQKDEFINVKFIINDVELEPLLFNSLMDNIYDSINIEAKKLVSEELQIVINKYRRLQEVFNEAIEKIHDEFDLPNNYD